MLCGGSFRAKTILKTEDHKIVKINGTEIKLTRSMSLTKAERSRRVFCASLTLPNSSEKRIELQTVSNFQCLIVKTESFPFVIPKWNIPN